MDCKAAVLIFFYGQLWCSHLSAESEGLTDPSLPASSLIFAAAEDGPMTQPFRNSSPNRKRRDTIKNEGREVTAAIPTVTIAQESKPPDGHVIGAVIIGVILVGMIAVMVGIFLWRRLKTTVSVDPHWAGRSPFADGDVLEIATDKEPAQSSKRASVLSLLPWKFNKNTLLLENDAGQWYESAQSLDAPPAHSAEKSDSPSSCPTATEGSISSMSLQTPISDGPSSLTEIPLQADEPFPEPLNLPPPPDWIGEVGNGLCPNGTQPLPFQPAGETLSSALPDFSCENLGEVAEALPPPPEEFF